jgi:hypothetical protein
LDHFQLAQRFEIEPMVSAHGSAAAPPAALRRRSASARTCLAV